MQSRVYAYTGCMYMCVCVYARRSRVLSRQCLNPSAPIPLPFPAPSVESRWKSVAERMREIAVAEDSCPDDEPPANLIPSSRSRRCLPGQHPGAGCYGTRNRTLGIASRFVCPEGIPDNVPKLVSFLLLVYHYQVS